MRLTERSGGREVIADTSSEVELFAVDDDACVPNAINLLADKLLGHGLGHAL